MQLRIEYITRFPAAGAQRVTTRVGHACGNLSPEYTHPRIPQKEAEAWLAAMAPTKSSSGKT